LVNFFFFQAEDGIRDGHVTGVQTCALPISCGSGRAGPRTGWHRQPLDRAEGATTHMTRSDHTGSGRTEVLVAEGLQKAYGPRQALRGLSFTLKAGRLLGFLGPNGAGKTTSIR